MDKELIEKIKALPEADIYVIEDDLTSAEIRRLQELWTHMQEYLNRNPALLIMPAKTHIRPTTKEEVKKVLNDIIERL